MKKVLALGGMSIRDKNSWMMRDDEKVILLFEERLEETEIIDKTAFHFVID